MMKILIVHNDYGKYSGEEAVVDRMVAMLTEHGHEVAQLRMTSAGSRETLKGKIHGFVAGLYSPSGVKAMREALRREQPDVVNVHNLYPFISPASLVECRKAGVPVVMTVHNFRLICPTGLFMRDGRPCEHCLDRGNEWGCVRYNCEHSMLKSVGYAARNAVARIIGAYRKNVTRYACITGFQRRKLIEAGFDADRITVIPNAVDLLPEQNEYTEGRYVAYCGRLSYEKGYDRLIAVARRHPEIEFRFAGAQRLPDNGVLPDNVKLLGYLNGDELKAFYRECRFVVMPSRCYEGFPMAILEAAQYSKPTIGPDHGGFTEIIGRGEEAIGGLFEPSSVDDLERRVVELWNDPEAVRRLGAKAHDKLRHQYSSEVIYTRWEQLFSSLTINR